MPPIDRRLQLLKGLPAAVRADILVEASANPGSDELRPLLLALCETGDPAAVAQVVRHVHKLSDLGSAMLREVGDRSLTSGIRRAIATRDRQSMVNAIELIRRHGSPDFAGDLVDLLEVRVPAIAELAVDALLETVVAMRKPLVGHDPGSDEARIDTKASRARLDRALARAAQTQRRHRQERALLAIGVASARSGPLLRELLEQPDHPIVLELRTLPALIDEPIVRRMMLRWLVQDNLRPQVSRWLGKLRKAEQLADLLSGGHLMRAPQRRRALRRIERPASCMPSLDEAVRLPDSAQRHLPAYVAGLDVPAMSRITAMADWIALPDAAARLQCVRALARHEGSDAMTALERFSGDRDPVVAAAAQRQVLGDSPQGLNPASGLLARCLDGADAALRRRAAAIAAGRDVDSFFVHWLTIPAVDRVLAARQLLAGQRDRFVDRIGEIVAGGQRETTLSAIALLRRLRLACLIETELIRRIGSDDARIAASATAALAECHSPRSAAALRIALQYDDARVRANSVEALAARALNDDQPLLAAMSRSRENRARGNAIRGLLKRQPELGRVRLTAMLGDEDARHRISAVWVASKGHVPEVGEALRFIARQDRSPDLRERAEAALRLLRCRGRRAGIVQDSRALLAEAAT